MLGKSTTERGFASMDPKKQEQIARKGGQTVSQDRRHMAEIGRKGGEAVSQNRQHMAEIGRKGGEAGGRKSKKQQPPILIPMNDESNKSGGPGFNGSH